MYVNASVAIYQVGDSVEVSLYEHGERVGSVRGVVTDITHSQVGKCIYHVKTKDGQDILGLNFTTRLITKHVPDLAVRTETQHNPLDALCTCIECRSKLAKRVI